jgi:phospholipid/cholesterol/gamma-HCH transport system substrate-binding protein
VAQIPGLVSASKPWLAQARPLLSGKEAGGVARLLAKSTPGLAEAAFAGKSVALPQLNRLSLCTTKVLVPTANQVINDRFSTGGPSYREFLYNLTNLAGQTQNYDGNGPFLRLQAGGGSQLVSTPNPSAEQQTDKVAFAHTAAAPIGTQPQLGGKPPLKPAAPCYKNPVPDVNGPLGQVGAPSPAAVSP